MKRFLLLVSVFLAHLVQGQTVISNAINWPEFISRHNLVWEDLPLQWNEGAFAGNGMLGMMVYVSEMDSGIVFSLGRTDITDHRKAPDKKTSASLADASVTFDFCRLPVGKMVLKPAGKILSGKITQDIWSAEISGDFETTLGKLSFKAFVPRNPEVQVVEVIGPKMRNGKKGYHWQFIPGNPFSPRGLIRPGEIKDYQSNPAPEISKKNNYRICRQELLAGGDYATVWTEALSASGSTLFVTTANEVPKSGVSVPVALTSIKKAQQKGSAALAQRNRNWWHRFYPQSFLSIPDARVESFYWIQLYKMASASRVGGPAVDLFGPFYKTSSWPGMWWNLNIQLTYLPVYESNHLELGENLIDVVDENFDGLLKRLSARAGLGDVAWTLHNYWKQFAYKPDPKALVSKWLPKALLLYSHYEKVMQKEPDGKIGLKLLKSPEYGGNATYPNTNYNLACLKWLLGTMIDVSETAQVNSEKIREWKDILVRIMPYPIDENGLKIASNQAVDESHRHYSHLLALYPLFLLDPYSPQDSALITRSVYHWHNVENGKGLAGYSFTGAASLFAALGRGDDAIKNIKQLMDGATGISQFHANTFYTESGGANVVIETPLSGAASIMELLMQSRQNKIIVFPALPSHWKNAAFSDLLAEGGYLVSAAYRQGRADWIAIKSKTGAPFTLRNEDLYRLKSITATAKFRAEPIAPNEVRITLPAGAIITFKQSIQTDVRLQPVAYTNGKTQSFGVKKGQQLKHNQDHKVADFIYYDAAGKKMIVQ